MHVVFHHYVNYGYSGTNIFSFNFHCSSVNRNQEFNSSRSPEFHIIQSFNFTSTTTHKEELRGLFLAQEHTFVLTLRIVQKNYAGVEISKFRRGIDECTYP